MSTFVDTEKTNVKSAGFTKNHMELEINDLSVSGDPEGKVIAGVRIQLDLSAYNLLLSSLSSALRSDRTRHEKYSTLMPSYLLLTKLKRRDDAHKPGFYYCDGLRLQPDRQADDDARILLSYSIAEQLLDALSEKLAS